MQKIVIISDVQSYLLVTIKNQLEESGFLVQQETLDTNTISKIANPIDLFLIFTDEGLLENHQGLIYLKDRAVEDDIPIYVIGDPNELKELRTDIPLNLILKEFYRPINVQEVSDAIEHFLKYYGNANKKKILVVDDSGAMLRNVKGWLEDKYQVILANSGAMAMKYLARNKPDLVLLDYEMPIVNGSQVLGMIRSETEFTDIPVIFLTNKGDKESVMNVMALKPDGYLLKTMEPEKIRNTIDEFFMKRKAQIK